MIESATTPAGVTAGDDTVGANTSAGTTGGGSFTSLTVTVLEHD
jgi:hypothetical protein